MTVTALHVTGTRGEVHPLMQARVDTEFYQSAWARARNVVVSRYGPMVRVPGTLAEGRPKTNGGKVRLLPFKFNEQQVYTLEFGEGYVRFWSPAGQVFDNGNPYEVVTPYTAPDMETLHAVQSGDTLYLFCENRALYVLRRLGETDWTIEPFKSRDGPFMDPNTTGTTLTLADRGSLTPFMTGMTSPNGEVITHAGTAAWRAFDGGLNTNQDATWGGIAGYVGYILPGSQTAVANAYWVVATAQPNALVDTPTSWVFEASNDGSSWVALDSQPAQYGWALGEKRFFEFGNTAAYRMYRLRWTAVDGGDNSRISELGINRAAESQTPFFVTASSTEGVNDDAGFRPVDIGRHIRFLGSDGRWRWMEITAYQSPTQVRVRTHGHALPDTMGSVNWALGVFHEGEGPRTGVIYEDRLVLAGSKNDPVGMWFSVSAAYDLFRQSQPLVADDGFAIRLTGGTLDAIQWLSESGQLLAGTASVLRSVGARGAQSALAHDNIKQRAETHVGAARAIPETVENVTLFIDRMQKKLFEAAFSFEADGYIAREVSTLSGHLFSSGVEQSVFIDAPHKVLVVRRTDGRLVFFSYDREQKIAGGTLVDVGGFVEDLCVLRGEGYPQLWMAVRRERGSGEDKFIETLAHFHEEAQCNCINGLTEFDPPVYGASSYVYEGAPASALTGLDALRGVTVGVWADGRDIGDVTVTSGGVLTLPHGTVASRIVVGERMPFYLESLRINSYGQQDGAGLGRKVRVVKARVDLYDSAGVLAGSKLAQYHLRRDDDVEDDPDKPTPLVTEMVPIPVEDSFQNSAVFVIRGNSMYPAAVRAVSLDVEGEP